MAKKKAIRSVARLTKLDNVLREEGNREAFEAIAVNEVLAWQIEQTMKENNISRTIWPSAQGRRAASAVVAAGTSLKLGSARPISRRY